MKKEVGKALGSDNFLIVGVFPLFFAVFSIITWGWNALAIIALIVGFVLIAVSLYFSITKVQIPRVKGKEELAWIVVYIAASSFISVGVYVAYNKLLGILLYAGSIAGMLIYIKYWNVSFQKKAPNPNALIAGGITTLSVASFIIFNMIAEEKPFFGIVDVAVVLTVGLIPLGIGLFMKWRNHK
ncbi:MAG: hypothetical protein V1702_00740 [Candidatus Woesearchaeota archaeon]